MNIELSWHSDQYIYNEKRMVLLGWGIVFGSDKKVHVMTMISSKWTTKKKICRKTSVKKSTNIMRWMVIFVIFIKSPCTFKISLNNCNEIIKVIYP